MIRKIILAISILLISGCLQIEYTTTYVPCSTKIAYVIRYGYNISCTGKGDYKINYKCDIPSVLKGSVVYEVLNKDYEKKDENSIIWNISGEDEATFTLGIVASIEAESFLVPDLNGKRALKLFEIQKLYPEIVERYCKEQSNGSVVLIDPYHPLIKMVAYRILNESDTKNSFILAKSLFIWLKENIDYKTHGEESVQPCVITLRKGSGDCDDLSFLYVALCRAIGIPARFIRGYLLCEEDGKISALPHAWAEVFVGGEVGNGGWIPVECASFTKSIEADINQNFGVEDAFHVRLFVDEGDNESINLSLTGIYVEYVPSKNDVEIESFLEVKNYVELESKKLVVTQDKFRYYE